MAEKQQVASNKAGIELAAEQATPRTEAPLDVSENAVSAESLSELNALLVAQDTPLVFNPLDPLIPIVSDELDLNNLEATAAGAGLGNGEGSGSSFVRLLRIAENTTGNSYAYGFNPNEGPEIVFGTAGVEASSNTLLSTTASPVSEQPDKVETGNETSKPVTSEPTSETPQIQAPSSPPVPTSPETPSEPIVPEQPIVPEPPVTPEPEEPEEPVTPEEPEEPVTPEEPPKNPKEHEDNGKGNGVDNAPGGSGDTPGDDADGSNTPGTKDTLDPRDVLPDEDDIPLPSKGNNGFGNGDQSAPGNSGLHNNAENDLTPNLDHPNLSKLLNMEQHNNIHP